MKLTLSKLKRGMEASIESEAFEGPIDGIVDKIGLKVGKNDVLNTDPRCRHGCSGG